MSIFNWIFFNPTKCICHFTWRVSNFFLFPFFRRKQFQWDHPCSACSADGGITGLIPLKLFPTKKWEEKKRLNLFQSHKVHLPIYLKGINFFLPSHSFVGNSFNEINPVVPAPSIAGTTALIPLKLFPTKKWEEKRKLKTTKCICQFTWRVSNSFSIPIFLGNSFNGINPVVPAPPMSVGLHAPLLAPHSDSINTNNPLQPRPGMQNC